MKTIPRVFLGIALGLLIGTYMLGAGEKYPPSGGHESCEFQRCRAGRLATPASTFQLDNGARAVGMVVTVLAVLAAFGAFGGMLAAWGQVPIVDLIKGGLEKTYVTWGRLRGITFLGGLWGAGGGLVFGVVLTLDGKFRDLTHIEAERFVFLACASVAAGFSGIRLLRLVSGKLEEQVDKAQKEAEEAKQLVAEVSKVAQDAKSQIAKISAQTQQLAGALSFAGQVLGGLESAGGKPEMSSIRRALEVMEAACIDNSTLRIVGIYLGRLFRALDNYAGAIAALTKVFDARRVVGQEPDADDRALLYNRACYRNVLRKKVAAGDPAQATVLHRDALSDLSQAIKNDPVNRAEAEADPDLMDLMAELATS
jgi:hypothetical protein